MAKRPKLRQIQTVTNPNLKPRWYRPTPDRLILGLLAIEILLLLSEQFQWFPFNEKKGWTVLIAIAAVCLVLVVMLLWLVVSLLVRWRFQFSLRSLVVLVVAVAIPSCWFAVKMRQAERQRKAVAALCPAYQTQSGDTKEIGTAPPAQNQPTRRPVSSPYPVAAQANLRTSRRWLPG